MPPPSTHPSLRLQVLSGAFFVAQYQPGYDMPSTIKTDLMSTNGGFLSLTKTNEEISLVGEYQYWMPDDLKQLSTWTCIKIMGPMEHDLTGVMAAFTTPLKTAEIPVFAISTWNTDYVLVPQKRLAEAVGTLEGDGWIFIISKDQT